MSSSKTQAVENVRVIYSHIPNAMPRVDEDFRIDRESLNLAEVSLPQDQGVVLRTLYLSLDSYMRGRMRDPKGSHYAAAFSVGEPMHGGAIAEVVQSTYPKLSPGDIVMGDLPWQSYTIIQGEKDSGGVGALTKLDSARSTGLPLSYYLGVLGMPAWTAYGALLDIGKPKAGETLFVSAASGAVGQVAGQVGKNLGMYVVGTAGDDEKVAYLTRELGFDAAFNYKKCKDGDCTQALKNVCPNGIDVYYENIGGKMLDAVLNVANNHARIVVCGMQTFYNRANEDDGVHNLIQLAAKSITMRGFVVNRDLAAYQDQSVQEISGWIKEGKFKFRENITEGVENAPQAFVDLLNGKNFGKAVVKVAEP
ncbi:NADP-dependent leukotriene B4 12-hydroxydehydrogenase [Piptocephalis cylindrospora]|uniref:NADP-dependent leukotriene B4 12-hydroxydehydrogenase n=1 Tax=Piptocephalis cylindrospora TaxID=1907219 RepID=A0A4P9Y7R3_9FUNG|nr:NADP-dependent leukotriene B4 12-hydroxydehydrogenase [Piptocephalis cylindrospora]|eukprot:RKP15186.1 NADP-dependent leukotriene B4 12-hydroxydehydrogenase [Piptocephalis cylindrospora]